MLLCEPPLFLVLFHLVLARLLPQWSRLGSEFIRLMILEHLRIDLSVLLEDFRDCFILIDRFPWTCRLTCCTVNALIGMDIKLVWILVVRRRQIVDAIDWTDLHTLNVFAIDTEFCYNPRHR